MNTQEIKVGDTVAWAQPELDEIGERWTVIEDNGNRLLIEAICDMRLKPTKMAKRSELVKSDPPGCATEASADIRMPMSNNHVAALVRRIKSDVNTFIREGVIPPTVSSFSELHDYLDANTLGDTEVIAEDMEWVEFIDTCNKAFDEVDEWLRNGRPISA